MQLTKVGVRRLCPDEATRRVALTGRSDRVRLEPQLAWRASRPLEESALARRTEESGLGQQVLDDPDREIHVLALDDVRRQESQDVSRGAVD